MRKTILVSSLALMAFSASAQLQTNAAGKTRISGLSTMQKTVVRDKAGRMPAPAIVAPDAKTYGNSFGSKEEFETLLVIDGNKDEKVWEFYADVNQNFARCNYNSSLTMDDWLVTPGFELEAGRRYIISFTAFSSGNQYPELIEALVGKERTAEAMTIPVIAPTVVDWDDTEKKAIGAYFTPETSGTYYLGVHGISEPDKNWLAVTDIRVSSPDAEIVLPPESGTFECTFDTQADFAQFLPVDCNEDGKTWKYVADKKWASCAFNSTLNMDDWMISPAIELEGGRSYLIGFKACCSDPQYPERMEVAIGTRRTAEGMTIPLMKPTMVTLADMQDYRVYFTPDTSGSYYLGFHGMSDPDMNWLAVDDIRVSLPDVVVVPGEDAIKFNEELIYSQDFANVGGSLENPVNLVGEKCALNGLEGWRGISAYGVGGAVLIDGIANSEHELVPPAIRLPGNNVRVEMTGRCIERNQTTVENFGGWEYMEGAINVASSQQPDGWRWSGTNIRTDFPADNSDMLMTHNLEFNLGEKVMMVDNDLLSWTVTDVGEYPVDSFTGRFRTGFGSKAIITGYKVYLRKPSIDKPKNLRFSAYTPGHAKVTWDAVENADSYYVTLHAGEYNGQGDFPYTLTALKTKLVNGTEVEFDFDSSKPVFAEVIAAKGFDERSASSDYLKIHGVSTPELTDLTVEGDNAALTWKPLNEADHIAFTGYAGTVSDSDRDGFVIAEMDFSGLPDTPVGSDTPSVLDLSGYAYGWTAVPQIAFEGGAIVGDNYLGSWGGTYTTISSLPIDFSEIPGDITVTMTARTNNAAMVKASLHTYNEAKWNVTEAAASEYATLTTDFRTYVFTLPGGMDNATIQINTGGSDKIYIRNLKVTCDVPAGKPFMLPYFDGSLSFAAYPGQTTALCPLHTGKHTIIGYTTQAFRDEISGEYTLSRVLSNYSNRLSCEHTSIDVAVAPIEVSDAEAVYYNLQGIRVADTDTPGVYIRVQGDRKEKIIIH